MNTNESSAPAPAESFFLCRLLPPRPTFTEDMTLEERQIMQAHVGYWRDLLAQGRVIVFGPVLDPKGTWGVGIVRARDLEAVRQLERGDPTIQSGRGFSYEILPMAIALFREPTAAPEGPRDARV